MILLDYSAIAVANILVMKMEIKENLIRHMILNSIRAYRKRFKDQYGEMVICCDASNNWRRSFYPEYKASRRTSREKSSLDWNEIFRIINSVRDELKENFPYHVLYVDGAEADDIIAQLCFRTGDFGQYEDVLIISGDKDFAQLQTLKNVKQFSPMTKKFIDEPNPRTHLMNLILSGDTSDGVPNVLSDDKCFVEERRQTPLSKKKKESLMDDPEVLGTDIYRNFLRNKKMIDLSELPSGVKQKIINNFEQQDPWHNKGKVFPYLVQNRLKSLLENVEEFIS